MTTRWRSSDAASNVSKSSELLLGAASKDPWYNPIHLESSRTRRASFGRTMRDETLQLLSTAPSESRNLKEFRAVDTGSVIDRHRICRFAGLLLPVEPRKMGSVFSELCLRLRVPLVPHHIGLRLREAGCPYSGYHDVVNPRSKRPKG